ncbi:MAG: CofH family radical SAM protein [Rikenellaceae bacterium]
MESSRGRLTPQEGLALLREGSLAELGFRAVALKRQLSGDRVFYNRNIHIEPTNICQFRCSFCSYRRGADQQGAWYYSIEQMAQLAAGQRGRGITEVHIVGGVHPDHDLDYYCRLISAIQGELPEVAIKAYSAVEIYYIIEKSGLTLREGMERLVEAGMRSIPGGGAEIFARGVREVICPEKCSAQQWLSVHETAHRLGLTTNATMLYGHIESDEDIIDHLDRLREQQDRSGGFNAFIPLKFKSSNNDLGRQVRESSLARDMRIMAISRLYLDNFPHIKAYWPMLGVEATELALSFGADDIDGTIDDTTKIYSMAGSTAPAVMSVAELERLAHSSGFRAVERDTFYNQINK